MKIIGIIRNKKDVERFKDIKIGEDKISISELWNNEHTTHQQPYFPAIIYQTPIDGLYWVYNNLTKREYEHSVICFDLFTIPQKELLDILLDHIVLDSYYSSPEEFVEYIMDENDLDNQPWMDVIKNIIKEYNTTKLLDKNYKVKIESMTSLGKNKKIEVSIGADNCIDYNLMYKGQYKDIKELAIDIVTRLDEKCYKLDKECKEDKV